MQMMLILVLGYILARAPLIQRFLMAMTQNITTPVQAIWTVTLVSMLACWINWGFGLVIGGLVANMIARKVKVDYALLIASAYSGFVIWHAGLSGSIPLSIASESHAYSQQMPPSCCCAEPHYEYYYYC